MKFNKKKFNYLLLLFLIAFLVKVLWLFVQIQILADRNGYLYETYTDEHFYHEEGVAIYEHLRQEGLSLKGAVDRHRDIRWSLHWGYPVMIGYLYYFTDNPNVNIIRFANVVSSTLSIILGFLILIQIGLPYRYSLFALLPVIVWPPINLFCSTSLKESSVIFLLLLQICFFSKFMGQLLNQTNRKKKNTLLYLFCCLIPIFLVGTVFRALLPISFLTSIIFTVLVIKKKTGLTLLIATIAVCVMLAISYSTPMFDVYDIAKGMIQSKVNNGFEWGNMFFQYIKFFLTPLPIPGNIQHDFRQIGAFTFLIKLFVTTCAVYFGVFTIMSKNNYKNTTKTIIIFLFFQIIFLSAGYVFTINEVQMRIQHQVWLPIWLLFSVALFKKSRDTILIGSMVSILVSLLLPVYAIYTKLN